MVPDINRQEWKDLIMGKLKPRISSFSLQMKLNTLINTYQNGLVSINDAVKDLHDMCTRYERIYKADLDQIFK